jgi:hypothetical protein
MQEYCCDDTPRQRQAASVTLSLVSTKIGKFRRFFVETMLDGVIERMRWADYYPALRPLIG